MKTEKKEYCLIEESRLRDLLVSEMRLVELESGGVDNWSWYGCNRREYLAELLESTDKKELIRKKLLDPETGEYDEDIDYDDIAEIEAEAYPHILVDEVYGECVLCS